MFFKNFGKIINNFVHLKYVMEFELSHETKYIEILIEFFEVLGFVL